MPFENTNNPSFLYYSYSHKEALARMSYAVQLKKLGVLLIGDDGTGKTFLSRVLKKMLPQDKFMFVFITNPRLEPIELTREIDCQLRQTVAQTSLATKADYLRSIADRLENYKSRDIHPIIVVDEGQSIQDDDLLEEIRLLLNIQSDDSTLFTLVLMGQPELEEKIESLPHLKQRLSIKYKLAPLSIDETKEYIEHRLERVGCTRNVFTDAAYDTIFAISKGKPRVINNICDLAFLDGFIKKVGVIDVEMINQVGGDLLG